MVEQPEYIIGIDLGDGESSIAFVSIESQNEPELFEFEYDEQRGQRMITAYAISRGKALIGDEALFAEGTYQNALNIKDKPTLDLEIWSTHGNSLMRFTEVFFRLFKKAYPRVAEGAEVYIGHPSGWSTTDIDLYQKLFEKADIPSEDRRNVKIKPESRAAFIQVRDYTGASKDKLNSVLVIDIGSSTTDFTFVKNYEPEEILVGDQFGARLIDCLIFNQVKEQCPQKEALLERLERNDRNEIFLLYLCRKAKERSFSKAPFTPKPTQDNFKWIIEKCWPLLKDLDMEAILQRPIIDRDIEAVLHRTSKSFPSGWKASFKEILIQAQEIYQRKYSQPLLPKVVLLTGGGSRMPFTEEICREVFKSVEVNPDREPFFAVARGLAKFGRYEYRVKQFHKDIDKFCTSPELNKKIRKHIDSFGKEVKKLLFLSTVDGVFRPMLHELHEGTLTPDEIGEYLPYFYKRLAQWLQTDEGRKVQEPVITKYIKNIEPYINAHTDDICDKYGIKKNSLELQIVLNPEEFFTNETLLNDLFQNLQSKLGNIVIGTTHRIMPQWVRDLVPKQVVDFFMDIEKLGREQLVEIVEFGPLNPDVRETFVDEVHIEICMQLHKRAEEVERLIR